MKGKPRSEETKQKIRESLKRRSAAGLPLGLRGSDPTLKRAPAGQVLSDLLGLVGYDVPPEVCNRWPRALKKRAQTWAAREHLAASDNPVPRMQRPAFLAEYERK